MFYFFTLQQLTAENVRQNQEFKRTVQQGKQLYNEFFDFSVAFRNWIPVMIISLIYRPLILFIRVFPNEILWNSTEFITKNCKKWYFNPLPLV